MSADPGSLPLSWQLTFLIIIMFLNGLVALSNAAMESVSRSKIRQMLQADKTDKKAEYLRILTERPSRYRYCNRMLNYILVIAGLYFAWHLDIPVHRYVILIAYIILLLSLAEILPRKLAKQHLTRTARRFAGIQLFMSTLLSPLTGLLMLMANLVLTILRQKTDVDEQEFSEDEVMSMLEVGQQSGVLGEEGKKMIGSIFQFDDERAYEIMTPRTDVFMIDIEDDPEEYVDQLMKLKFTRMPVCEGGSDNIIGVLHIKDYLIKARQEGFDHVNVEDILRKPYLVPETKKIDTLFYELQKEKQHIAILIDEYGGFSGIVTMEDIIEEIVGDIDDEYDEEDEIIEALSDGDYLIDGNVDLDDINEELGTDLTSENSETIGGFLFDMIGEIPNDGYINRTLPFENYVFTILSIKERRIEKVKLHIEPKSDDLDEEEREDA